MRATRISRRDFLAAASVTAASCGRSGGGDAGDVLIWGSEGLRDGSFLKPRAIGVLDGRVYVIDTTGRIQVFDEDGAFLTLWRTPDAANGTPTAVSFAADGTVVVPDTHYHRILEYSRDGELLKTWGEYGNGPDQFIYPTDIAPTADGYVVSEYGENAERIHVFDTNRRFARQWGSLGDGPGQFSRPMGVRVTKDGTIVVADTTNHRLQCFTPTGELVRIISGPGDGPGQLKYPFDIALAPDETIVTVEYGTHRISRFTLAGEFIASFGGPGRRPGEMNDPRGVAVSPEGMVFVADTGNHRVQRFPLERLA
ncbi:MAG: hypothetical protein AAB353_06300 [Candidatus Hydrogenedentota bacterium]